MTYNLPLLRKERDWVAEQRALPFTESQLNMDYWYDHGESVLESGKTCGTVYCVAGHIAETSPRTKWTHDGFFVVDGRFGYVPDFARNELGITRDEAFELFYSSEEGVLDVLDKLIAKAEAEERGEVEEVRA